MLSRLVPNNPMPWLDLPMWLLDLAMYLQDLIMWLLDLMFLPLDLVIRSHNYCEIIVALHGSEP